MQLLCSREALGAQRGEVACGQCVKDRAQTQTPQALGLRISASLCWQPFGLLYPFPLVSDKWEDFFKELPGLLAWKKSPFRDIMDYLLLSQPQI